MKKDISNWSLAECFLFGASLSAGRHFFAGEGDTGKKFQYYQSLDGSTASIITNVRPVPDNDKAQD